MGHLVLRCAALVGFKDVVSSGLSSCAALCYLSCFNVAQFLLGLWWPQSNLCHLWNSLFGMWEVV